jgi:hypothetical protein
MSESLLAKLERKLRNNPDIEDFTNLMISKFWVRKIHIHFMIQQEAKDLALFDAFTVEPESYIQQAINNCFKWSNLPRRKINAEDLTTYSIPYLFFQAIERKPKK